MKQKALLADKRGPRQPTAHRLGLLHTSVGRGTFPGFESLSRPPQGEDSLGEWLAANPRRSRLRFSAQLREETTTYPASSPYKSIQQRHVVVLNFAGFFELHWKCTCYHSNARPDRHEKETSQMVKFGHPYHLAFFTIVVFGQEATLLWKNIYVVVDRRQVFVFEDFFDFGRRTICGFGRAAAPRFRPISGACAWTFLCTLDDRACKCWRHSRARRMETHSNRQNWF